MGVWQPAGGECDVDVADTQDVSDGERAIGASLQVKWKKLNLQF